MYNGKHLPLMLRSTELNTFSMTKPIYRDLVVVAFRYFDRRFTIIHINDLSLITKYI